MTYSLLPVVVGPKTQTRWILQAFAASKTLFDGYSTLDSAAQPM
jgi:hypothetical protein